MTAALDTNRSSQPIGNDARLGELAPAFLFFKRVLRVQILPCPPYSLQLRELFSDFAWIRRFSGLFIDRASSKWAQNYAALPSFPLFFSTGRIGSPLSRPATRSKID